VGFQLGAAAFLVFEEIITVVVFRFEETTLLVVVVPADTAQTHALLALLGK